MSSSEDENDNERVMSSSSSSGEDTGSSEVGDNEDSDEDSDENYIDEEPLLKYRRLKSSVTEILSGGKSTQPDSASCLAFHRSFMVLGTRSGALYILDHAGAERNKIVLHHARVHDISIEPSGQRIASCAEDGKIAIIPVLGSEAPLIHTYASPIVSVQLDPEYSNKRDRVFVSGSEDSKIRINRRGWFTSTENILDSGEGRVQIVRWCGTMIAWANDRGVKIYDLEREKPVSRVDRPKINFAEHEGVASSCQCKLYWENDRTLLVGWGDCWMIVRIQEMPPQSVSNGTSKNSSGNISSNDSSKLQLSGRITAVFHVPALICGIASFGDDVCLLTYSLGNDDDSTDDDNSDGSNSEGHGGFQSNSHNNSMNAPRRPELRILDRESGEQRSCDMLPVFGYEMCTMFDYSLESDKGTVVSEPGSENENISSNNNGNNQFNTKSKSKDDADLPPLPSLYIVSPKDIVVATPRTVDDHIKWALEHGQFSEALEIAEHADPPLPPSQYQLLATRYLGNLVKTDRFREASKLCVRLLRNDKEMWQQWVLVFHEHQQLREIGFYVPYEDIQLEQSTYEMILAAFLNESDDVGFRHLIAKWLMANTNKSNNTLPLSQNLHMGMSRNTVIPKQKIGHEEGGETVPLFNMIIVVAKVKAVLERRESCVLRETLSYLYMVNGDRENAVHQYLDYSQNSQSIAESPLSISIFSFIEQNNLYHKLVTPVGTQRFTNLMRINEKRAMQLILKVPEDVLSIHAIGKQLQTGDPALLLKYLHTLFERKKQVYNSNEYRPWHIAQVSLYVRFDPGSLLQFLKSSNFYSMEKAIVDCEQSKPKPLYKEMVYILGRLGDSHKALSLIIDKIGDVKQAIEFIEESHNDALWEQLISKSLTNKNYVSGLLQDVGSTITNPAKLIQQIPDDMEIPNLRNHLAKFVSDYRLLLELQRGCNEVLKEDCIDLLQRLRFAQRSGIRVKADATCKMTGSPFHSNTNHHVNSQFSNARNNQNWEVEMETGEITMM
jgi:vacuolar protein sorting-associated protein 41